MKILVIAGPNGAGKTTFARRYLKREGDRRRFVNGDDIAAKLRPDDPAAVAQKAGRLALREMEAHVARGEDFATETTLSGRAYAKGSGGGGPPDIGSPSSTFGCRAPITPLRVSPGAFAKEGTTFPSP